MIYRYSCSKCTFKTKHYLPMQRHIDEEHQGGGRIISVVRDTRTPHRGRLIR